jgi:hypothetical protein
MRLTFTQLKDAFYRKIGVNSVDATTDQQIEAAQNINSTIRFMRAEMPNYRTSTNKTALTVANQQFYHLPPGVIQIDALTVTIGSVDYSLEPVESIEEWRRINGLTVNVTNIPSRYIARDRDFGIWPIPVEDDLIIRMDYTDQTGDLSADDYTTGTATVTQNSNVVTGAGTTWTAAMIGRWFYAADTKYWYKISGVNSSTELTLETVYEETTGSKNYTIGQTPDLPEEAHELIPWRAAALYFAGPREDAGNNASRLMNFFYTGDFNNNVRTGMNIAGGFLGVQRKYAQRTNKNVIHVRKDLRRGMQLREKFGVTVS